MQGDLALHVNLPRCADAFLINEARPECKA
jgi:hypothetical protein